MEMSCSGLSGRFIRWLTGLVAGYRTICQPMADRPITNRTVVTTNDIRTIKLCYNQDVNGGLPR